MLSRSYRSQTWVLLMASLLVTPITLFLGIGSAGAGHGDYLWAKIFFPYTMLSALLFQSITDPFMVLAIIQFPLCGCMLAAASERKRLKPWVVGLTLVHGVSTAVCLLFGIENF
jgi:hypothetical protein